MSEEENNSLFDEFLSMMRKVRNTSDENYKPEDEDASSSQKSEASGEVLRRLRRISDQEKEREKRKEELVTNEQKRLLRKKKREIDEEIKNKKLIESPSSLTSSSGKIEWSHSSFGGIFGSVDGKRKFSISKGIFLYTLKYKRAISDGKGSISIVNVVKNSPDVAKLKRMAEDALGSVL